MLSSVNSICAIMLLIITEINFHLSLVFFKTEMWGQITMGPICKSKNIFF